MSAPFDLSSWTERVVAWWQEAARDLPGTASRLGVRTAYGLLTASAWLPLLPAMTVAASAMLPTAWRGARSAP